MAGNVEAFIAGGEKSLLAAVAATHAGMTTEEFERTVKDWLAAAIHPMTRQRYTKMVYRPMLEVLAYLPANGFKTFIVSADSADKRPYVSRRARRVGLGTSGWLAGARSSRS
jgi:FMN phosphatase YigB (HAD superfamily)